jgi:hypothetical protein
MTLDINHLINQIVPFEPLFIPIANMDNHRTGIMYSNILFGLAILEKINIGWANEIEIRTTYFNQSEINLRVLWH